MTAGSELTVITELAPWGEGGTSKGEICIMAIACTLRWVVIPAIISLLALFPVLLEPAHSHGVRTCFTGCAVGAPMGPTLYDNATPILVGTVLAWVSFGIVIVLTGRFVHGKKKNVQSKAGGTENV